MKPLLEVLTSGTGYLAKKGIEEARLNMEHLLAHVLECRRMDIYLRFDQQLAEPQLERLRPLLRRRGEGEPLQHLLGTVEFCGHELVCDHRALVPRPETESLVELTLAELKSSAQPACTRILDMATGSGCIGLSLAKALPGTAVLLADVSEDALELAKLNTARLGLENQVRTLRTDLFDKLEGQRFDLIIANLPYIPASEIAALSREVRRDPVLALDGGPNGLVIVERFLQSFAKHLTDMGLIALEVGHDQGPATSQLCRDQGCDPVWLKADLAGIERFVFARKKLEPEPLAEATEPQETEAEKA